MRVRHLSLSFCLSDISEHLVTTHFNGSQNKVVDMQRGYTSFERDFILSIIACCAEKERSVIELFNGLLQSEVRQ